MYQENEILTLVLGIFVAIFIIYYNSQTKDLPFRKYLLAAYYLLLWGWFCTVAEGFVWYSFFNYSEHISYALGSVFLFIWSLKITLAKRKGK